MTDVVVSIEDIPVMYVTAIGGPAGSKEAFDKLESRLPDLKGRKFYGVLKDGEYRSCATLTEKDEPEKLGFEKGVIPGGKYARRKIQNWPEKLETIGPTFDAMAKEHPEDTNHPKIEFYRSQKELILLLPLKE